MRLTGPAAVAAAAAAERQQHGNPTSQTRRPYPEFDVAEPDNGTFRKLSAVSFR